MRNVSKRLNDIRIKTTTITQNDIKSITTIKDVENQGKKTDMVTRTNDRT